MVALATAQRANATVNVVGVLDGVGLEHARSEVWTVDDWWHGWCGTANVAERHGSRHKLNSSRGRIPALSLKDEEERRTNQKMIEFASKLLLRACFAS